MLAKTIVFQVIVCALANAQNYENDYSISDDDGKYTDAEEEQVDYSKYFNAPFSSSASAPLEENPESGFVRPLEFSSFFSSPQFGFSDSTKEALVIPSEIKQEQGFVPDDFKTGFTSNIDYFEQAQKETKNEDSVESKVPEQGGYQAEFDNYRQNTPSYQSQKEVEVKEVPYNEFKASPVDTSDYYKKYTQTPLTPYQKYSYQPTNSYGLGPYSPSYLQTASHADLSYEHVPTQNLKQGLCVKALQKLDDKMTCYVCKNPKTGVKSEHCSYEQEPKAYYRSMTKTYNRPDAYRHKRDSKKEYANPYEEVKAKSHSYFSQPEEFRRKFYSAPDFSDFEEYRYEHPEIDKESETEEKSYSEIQAEQVSKNKENCKEVQGKKGVTCVVCTDPTTGGNFEKCEYQSEPKEQKYAYVREQKYDGAPEEEVEEVEEESKPQKAYKESEADDDEEIPRHFVEVTKKHKIAGVRGLDPKLYGSPELKSKKYKDLTVFPKESKNLETRTKPEYFDATGKKDVEKVLEEFSKKDRSNCKEIKKKGMTCYLCVDKKGIQNEECMYVSESQPQSSLIAYHQLERTQESPEGDDKQAESKIKNVRSLPGESKAPDSEANASTQKEVRSKSKSESKVKSEPVPQFDVNDKGGLYTSETRPVYVKSLGMTLPKYMVEKTDYEKEFDQTVRSGRV